MIYPCKLPLFYLVTPEPILRPTAPANQIFADYIADLARTLATGIRLVQLRAKTLTAAQYAQLAQEALVCCRNYGARLLLNAPINLVQTLEADGIHLSSTNLMLCKTRPLPPELLVSAACHDAQQIVHANQIGVDLLTVSPVLPTATHTLATPIGWPRFQELAALSTIPVYALGGITPTMIPTARAAGAHGIAAIRSLWASPNAAPN